VRNLHTLSVTQARIRSVWGADSALLAAMLFVARAAAAIVEA